VKVLPTSSTQGARVVWINPARAPTGTNVTVVLTGANFDSDAVLAVSGEGIAASAMTVNSPTQITATFAIAASATPGIRDVTVSTASGASNAARFQVVARQTGSPRKKE